ncbi:MAG: ABC transporter permease [Bacteroidetes bacterium]|nr:ABC transporter permease [Bacteroidota bacterium]
MNKELIPALRSFRKYPVFSLINLGGLSIGIAASFILLIYSQREFSTDRHFKDANRIARIGTDFFHMGPFAISQPQLPLLAKAGCKDVENVTSISIEDKTSVRLSTQERAFNDILPYSIDAEFFTVFSYQASAGSIPQMGLAPGETILSENSAHKFFGNTDPIGKTLLIGKKMTPYKVVAVLKEGFEKSHLEPQLLLPRSTAAPANPNNWMSAALYNYVKLKPQGSIAGLNAWLETLRRKVIYPSSGATISYQEWTASNMAVSFTVQPLTSIYFDNNAKFDTSPGGNLTQVRLLSTISILLILLAIINYINLVTARASIRAKEMGLKKTYGAPRSTLVGQLLKESILFSLLAMLIACGLIQVILFLYQYSTGAALTGPIPFLSANYIWLLFFSLAVGALAGLYPAFYLTGLRPLLTIRSTTTSGMGSNSHIRNGLVTVQFVIATGLVFLSFVVYSQLLYMKNKDKGFQSEGIVLVDNIEGMKDRATTFQQLIEQQSQVASTSICERIPGSKGVAMYSYRTAAMPKPLSIQTFPVDDRYISTIGMHLSDGRDFNRHLASDTNALILNESAVAALGLFNPVGSVINGSEKVIGVVKDFNYASLHEKIGPAILRYSTRPRTLAIRLRGGNTASFLDWLGRASKDFQTEAPTISFLDDNFARLAEKERLLGQAISFFTILAIILATLGLIGLTIFTIERRMKEIGIRKVLGATRSDILNLISSQFIRLAAIASGIALPVSWWLANRWLNNFAYRISINVGTFFLTEALILLIAFAVIGLLTLRALAANPVKNLRTE